jgi:radical SAM superfamily enzyme YgiQ (UPF0313 family)
MAGWDARLILLPDPDELLYLPRPHRQDYPTEVLNQVCNLCAAADLVGISLISNFVGRARALTQAIHKNLSLPVIWGGIHPTVKPEECLTWADFVCVGEGEQAIVELVNRLATSQDYTNVANIWLKDDTGRVVTNSISPLNRSLDDLPLLDYELSQQFILHHGQLVPLTSELLTHYLSIQFANETRVVHMTCMTRGCPYECTYCCDNALAHIYPDWRRLRRHSPEYIVAEIAAVRQLIPSLQAVMFLDDAFLASSTDEIRHFSEVYREQVDLPFQILAAPGSIAEEKIHHLVQAGLQQVEMGIQTGSQRIRELFRRPENSDQVLAATKCLDQFRKWIPRPRYDLISSNPYATRADRLETLRLLYQLPPPFSLYLFSLGFYPGTELYRQAEHDGLIQDKERDIYRKNIAQSDPTYYNFVLWCIHRNLPRWLLWLLIRPLVFIILDAAVMKWPFRLFWKVIFTLRIRRARRVYLQQLLQISRPASDE